MGGRWRGFARAAMIEHGAASPLPTRQLKRATARQIGRLLEAKETAETRRTKIIAKRKRKVATQAALAAEHGVHPGTIQAVKEGHSWKHLL